MICLKPPSFNHKVHIYIPSKNALSSAKDLNFDTFFLMISYQGEQLPI